MWYITDIHNLWSYAHTDSFVSLIEMQGEFYGYKIKNSDTGEEREVKWGELIKYRPYGLFRNWMNSLIYAKVSTRSEVAGYATAMVEGIFSEMPECEEPQVPLGVFDARATTDGVLYLTESLKQFRYVGSSFFQDESSMFHISTILADISHVGELHIDKYHTVYMAYEDLDMPNVTHVARIHIDCNKFGIYCTKLRVMRK